MYWCTTSDATTQPIVNGDGGHVTEWWSQYTLHSHTTAWAGHGDSARWHLRISTTVEVIHVQTLSSPDIILRHFWTLPSYPSGCPGAHQLPSCDAAPPALEWSTTLGSGHMNSFAKGAQCAITQQHHCYNTQYTVKLDSYLGSSSVHIPLPHLFLAQSIIILVG